MKLLWFNTELLCGFTAKNIVLAGVKVGTITKYHKCPTCFVCNVLKIVFVTGIVFVSAHSVSEYTCALSVYRQWPFMTQSNVRPGIWAPTSSFAKRMCWARGEGNTHHRIRLFLQTSDHYCNTYTNKNSFVSLPSSPFSHFHPSSGGRQCALGLQS